MIDSTAVPEFAIETRGLTKHYGGVAALSDVSLSVPRGTIYGFLGPNGAGKTTTIKLLMGFIKPTSGSARIDRYNCWTEGTRARSDVGFLVQPDNLFSDMTGDAHLEFAAQLSNKSPVLRSRLLHALELDTEALQRQLGTYSKGMRQKLALTVAMQCNPALLILDEPTDGLDPLIQREFEQILRDLRDAGTTVFMSSHDLGEVDRNCQMVAVVRDGKLVAEESVEGLKRLHRRRAFAVFTYGVPANVDRIEGLRVTERSGNRVDFLIDGELGPLLDLLAAEVVSDVVITPPSLDDIFMGFYGQNSELPIASVHASAPPE